MIRELYLDTSGWIAALLPEQSGHAEAREVYRAAVAARQRVLTSNLVLAEAHSLMLRYRGAARAMEFYDDVTRDPLHDVIYADVSLQQAAVEQWMRPHADESYSLCDVVSFQLMKQERVRMALTFNRHFAAAGFQILR